MTPGGGASPDALRHLSAGIEAGAFVVVLATDLSRLTRLTRLTRCADQVGRVMQLLRIQAAEEQRRMTVERMAASSPRTRSRT